LDELTASPATFKGRARLMIVGSVLDNPEFIKSIEDTGGLVVADELCTSTRYWSDPVIIKKGEPVINAIARRYLSNFPVPGCIRRMSGLSVYLPYAGISESMG